VKKFLCLAIVLIAALPCVFSQGKTITVRVLLPVDLGGTANSKNSDLNVDADRDTKMGFGLGAEAMVGIWKGLKVGGGIQYGLGRGLDDKDVSKDARFWFIPFYGLAAYGWNLGLVNPYAITRVGYAAFGGNSEMKNGADLSGGLCFMLGGGARLKIPGFLLDPFAELNYAVSRGSEDFGGNNTYDVTYKRLQLCVGAGLSL